MEIGRVGCGWKGMNTGILLITAGRLKVAKSSESTSKRARPTGDQVHRCHHCQRVIYSRRFSTCRDCGGELKGEMGFNPGRAAQLEVEQNRCRDRMRRLDTALGSIRPMGTLTL